ncbi:MAG: hypothetical protein ACTSQP_18535, partial [Promethearchaeota archaeon]
MVNGRTWKNIDKSVANQIKNYLLENGGEYYKIKAAFEVWRIKFLDSIFTYYTNGTLFSTSSKLKDPILFKTWEF